MISECGKGESGWRGQKAGDNTGSEWAIRSWYSYPWNAVLRHPSIEVANMLCNLHIKAANNNHIGYDMDDRYTYETELVRAGYDPTKVVTNCETDCSAAVIAHIHAAGALLSIDSLFNCSATYTGNMRARCKKAGFDILIDSKYLSSEKYLQPGDILLNDDHHTCIYVGDGKTIESGGFAFTGKTHCFNYSAGMLYTAPAGYEQPVYCDSSCTDQIGTLDPSEKCYGLAKWGDVIVVEYKTAHGWKVGYVRN